MGTSDPHFMHLTTSAAGQAHRHVAQFYDDEQSLATVVGHFLADGLRMGEPAVVIAEPHRIENFRATLAAQGLDVSRLIADGVFVCLDARATLATFMDATGPDAERFRRSVGGVIRGLIQQHGRHVRAFGEMVDILWRDGDRAAAIQLEELWNHLAEEEPFRLLCAYAMANFYRASDADDFARVCAAHDRVFPAEGDGDLGPVSGRGEEIARLQQRSRVLEREIEQRRELEHQLRVALAERRRVEEELRDFVDNAAEGLHRVGADGTILWANRAELEMLGYARDEYVGHNISEFYADPTTLDDVMQRLARGETLREYETELRCRDGSIKFVLINSNVFWEDGRFVHTRCFTRDITSRRQEDMISRHFNAIIRSSEDAIVSKDLDGIIKSWNPAAERMFGFTEAEAIGRSIRMIIPDDRQSEEDTVLGRIRRGESIEHFETIRQRKDGSELAVSLSVSPILGADGEIVGASKIARDITERRQSELEREQLLQREQDARREADRANRLKDDFLALVSHELRTPIQAIYGWVKIAKSLGDPEGKMLRALDVIERNVQAQVRLVDDLLDAARIATGKLQIASEPVSLPRTILDAVESARPSATAKGLELEVRIDPGVYIVMGDATRLQQIVTNLLSNAVKFTLEGRVDVALHREGMRACLSVRDTGRGIAPEFLPLVFDRFRQADTGADRQESGLGLGLTIVQHLVEAHGGSIAADSEGVNRGATFSLSLPLIEPPAEILGLDLLDVSAPPVLEGVRVLVVDDIGDSREILQYLLQQRGAQVNTAPSVDDALTTCETHEFDVLLSDLSMPTRDGFALIDAVRKARSSRLRHVPAIAVTAHADANSRAEALAAGFDDFLVKPVAADELISASSRLLAQPAKSTPVRA
jgi:PAS domain S-box-containing protein